MSKAEDALKLFEAAVGQSEGTGEWLEVTQDRINAFADVTEDHQFIHVDPKLASELSPWGVTIAHGFLTLSLLVKLAESIPQPAERFDGVVMGVNYGFEKVRFINAVKVGSKIRCSSVLAAVELKDPNTLQTTRTMTVEIDGESKPALVADWLTRIVYG
ncbi:MAG: MaoC family dehydratase [Frankiaceae bacterium]|nr:MaoC family dehydratase [Frankiaceae bacterium]MBV9872385.1 MaoC family dehydratase [Frankiaceae bacterium]